MTGSLAGYRVLLSTTVLLTLLAVAPVAVKVVTRRTLSECVFLAARAFAVRRQMMVILPAAVTVLHAVHMVIMRAFFTISVACEPVSEGEATCREVASARGRERGGEGLRQHRDISSATVLSTVAAVRGEAGRMAGSA